MLVVKKSGNLQDFQLEKIKTSMMRASDDINQPLNEADSHILAERINNKINANYKEKIKWSEIRTIVGETLISCGFSNVAKSYEEGAK